MTIHTSPNPRSGMRAGRTASLLAGLALLGLSAMHGLAVAVEPLNINAATAQELAAAIDGVGVKKAQAIVAYREAHGPFRSVDDLTRVSGIGKHIVEQSRPNLRAE